MAKSTISIRFTKKQLWSLIAGFESSYIEGELNKTEERVSEMLWEAYQKLRHDE